MNFINTHKNEILCDVTYLVTTYMFNMFFLFRQRANDVVAINLHRYKKHVHLVYESQKPYRNSSQSI